MSSLDVSVSKASPEVTEEVAAAPAASNKRYLVVAAFVAVVLCALAFTQSTQVVRNSVTNLRGLLDLTVQGDVMPVPFWVIRQDVPQAWKTQDAFYSYYYLRNREARLKESDGTGLSVKFFEKISRENTDGTQTVLGYFNPVAPQGLPSNVFNFEYGDKCEATNDYREGFVELVCGDSLSLLSIEELKPCKYKIVAATPERCGAEAAHPYLAASAVEANDGQYWTYKINFFKHADSPSHVFAYHKDARRADRVLLGSIDSTLNTNRELTFSNGDLNPVNKKRRSGVIRMECGCEYGVKSLTEKAVGNYEVVVSHPKACAAEPAHCSSNLKAALTKTSATTQLTSKPSESALGSFPRDLLHPKH